MRGKLMFFGGLAAGFVLGSRAGRQAYDELVRTISKVKDSPTVQEAAGVVQAQANKLYEQGKGSVGERLNSSKLGERFHNRDDEAVAARHTNAADPINEL